MLLAQLTNSDFVIASAISEKMILPVLLPTLCYVPHATVPRTAVPHASMQPLFCRSRIVSSEVSADDEKEDWVAARMAAEDAAFKAKREAANLARHAAWAEEERALRTADSEAQAGQDVVAEYEARMREAARPKTEEEKREAYAQDQLAQIDEANAMDERLRQKQRAARRGAGLE